MRKVIYKEWVRGVETEEYKQWKKAGGICQPGEYIPQPTVYAEGTNCNVEKPGLFHGFFNAYEFPDGTTPVPSPFAIIEKEDGSLMEMHPSLIRFVDSPDAEQLAEFAKAAMQGFLSNHQLVERLEEGGELFHDLVCDSISMANIMIAELKKQKP